MLACTRQQHELRSLPSPRSQQLRSAKRRVRSLIKDSDIFSWLQASHGAVVGQLLHLAGSWWHLQQQHTDRRPAQGHMDCRSGLWGAGHTGASQQRRQCQLARACCQVSSTCCARRGLCVPCSPMGPAHAVPLSACLVARSPLAADDQAHRKQWLRQGLPRLAVRLLQVRHRCVQRSTVLLSSHGMHTLQCNPVMPHGTELQPDTLCRPEHALHAWTSVLPQRSPMLIHRLPAEQLQSRCGPALAARAAAYLAAQEEGFQVGFDRGSEQADSIVQAGPKYPSGAQAHSTELHELSVSRTDFEWAYGIAHSRVGGWNDVAYRCGAGLLGLAAAFNLQLSLDPACRYDVMVPGALWAAAAVKGRAAAPARRAAFAGVDMVNHAPQSSALVRCSLFLPGCACEAYACTCFMLMAAASPLL